jgi:predicted transcriptional regulator
LLKPQELKGWLHRDLKQLPKLLLILATFENPCSLEDLRERAASAGFKIPKGWNPSSTLSKSKGLAIRVPDGWELTDSGRNYLRNLGIETLSPAAVKVASDLRQHLDKIANPTTRVFAEEAIKCHEAQLFRSAIVMSWIAAVDVLHREVVKNHLSAFNVEAKNADSKWKAAVNADGIGRMNEAAFLDRIAAIGMIGKNQKDELAKALKLRNGCGHPNSLKVGPNTVASHLELLLLNVFEQFST